MSFTTWLDARIVVAATAAAKIVANDAEKAVEALGADIKDAVNATVTTIATDVDGEIKQVVLDVDQLADKIISGVLAKLPDFSGIHIPGLG